MALSLEGVGVCSLQRSGAAGSIKETNVLSGAYVREENAGNRGGIGRFADVSHPGGRLCETGHALELYMSNLFTIHSRLPAIQSQN